MGLTQYIQLWLSIWSLAFAGAVHAQSFFEVLVGHDYASLASAVLFCILGGLARTTWDLNDRNFVIPVGKLWREVRGNVLFALITGMFVHLALEAARPHWSGFSPSMRLLIVFGSGFARTGFMGWLAKTVHKVGDEATERIVTVVKGNKEND